MPVGHREALKAILAATDAQRVRLHNDEEVVYLSGRNFAVAHTSNAATDGIPFASLQLEAGFTKALRSAPDSLDRADILISHSRALLLQARLLTETDERFRAFTDAQQALTADDTGKQYDALKQLRDAIAIAPTHPASNSWRLMLAVWLLRGTSAEVRNQTADEIKQLLNDGLATSPPGLRNDFQRLREEFNSLFPSKRF